MLVARIGFGMEDIEDNRRLVMESDEKRIIVPALVQFGWYLDSNLTIIESTCLNTPESSRV